MLVQRLANAKIHRQRITIKIHSRCAVKFGHQHRCLSHIKSADDSIEPLAPANTDPDWTEFRVGVKSSESFRDLKWNLKTRAVLGQTAAHGRLREVENDSWKHRHVDAAFFFVEKSPLHRRFRSAQTADRAMILAREQHRRGLQRELDMLADSVVQIDRRQIE